MRLSWPYAAWAAACAFVVTGPWMPHPLIALYVAAGAFLAARLAGITARRKGDPDHGYAAAGWAVGFFAGMFPVASSAGALAASLFRGESLPNAVSLASGFLLMGILAGAVAALLALPVAIGGTYLFAKGVQLWLNRGE
jgi:fucose permease